MLYCGLVRELDNLNAKLESLKSIFETASGVCFKSTTLQRKSVSEVSRDELNRELCC